MIAHLIGALRHGTKQRAAIKARITAPWRNRVRQADYSLGSYSPWPRGRFDIYDCGWPENVPPAYISIPAMGPPPGAGKHPPGYMTQYMRAYRARG